MVVMETIQTICKCLGSVDVLLSRFGDRLELYLRGRRWKYPAEILLRVPLIFLMHHWCVLSPTSSYWFIEIFLFIFRYLGASLLFFVSRYTAETIIPLYIATGTDILFGWILETNYWILQNEADGMCAIWWFDIKNPWLTVSIGTILHSVYLAKTYDSLISFKPYKIRLPLITILPFLLCMTTILMSISASVYYWYSKLIFAVPGFCQVNYYYSISVLPLGKLRNLTREEINQLIPAKSFIRDLALTFAVLYIILCIFIDMVRLPEITVFSTSYLSAFVRDWCTSLVIVAAFISSVFGILSLLVAASRYLVTCLKNMKCIYCLLVAVVVLLLLLCLLFVLHSKFWVFIITQDPLTLKVRCFKLTCTKIENTC